jgi:hypothetical protein
VFGTEGPSNKFDLLDDKINASTQERVKTEADIEIRVKTMEKETANLKIEVNDRLSCLKTFDEKLKDCQSCLESQEKRIQETTTNYEQTINGYIV